mgnify:CR=1 FL=1
MSGVTGKVVVVVVVVDVVVDVDVAGFFGVDREHQRPLGVGVDRLHEAVGDEQRQVELAQVAVFALGADEIFHVRMSDIEGAHLRAATPAPTTSTVAIE